MKVTDIDSPYADAIAAMINPPYAKAISAMIEANKATAEIIAPLPDLAGLQNPISKVASSRHWEAQTKFDALFASLRDVIGTIPPSFKTPSVPLQKEPAEMQELAYIWEIARAFTHNPHNKWDWSKSQFMDAFKRIGKYSETLAERALGEGKALPWLWDQALDGEAEKIQTDFAPTID